MWDFGVGAPLFYQGKTPAQIARAMGLRESTVKRRLRDAGLSVVSDEPSARGGTHVRAGHDDKIGEMRERGMSYAAIGKELGITRQRAQQIDSRRKKERGGKDNEVDQASE